MGSKLADLIRIKRLELDEILNSLSVVARNNFHDIVKEAIFDKYPSVESVSWNQHTPYFNDGDPCEFSVNTYPENLLVNGKQMEDLLSEKEGGSYPFPYDKTYWDKDAMQDNPNYDPSRFDIYYDMEEVLDALGNDILKYVFGDHVEITISRDGTVQTSNYQHE